MIFISSEVVVEQDSSVNAINVLVEKQMAKNVSVVGYTVPQLEHITTFNDMQPLCDST